MVGGGDDAELRLLSCAEPGRDFPAVAYLASQEALFEEILRESGAIASPLPIWHLKKHCSRKFAKEGAQLPERCLLDASKGTSEAIRIAELVTEEKVSFFTFSDTIKYGCFYAPLERISENG